MTLQDDAQTFREAMARLGAAVNIVTTDGPAGRHGLTVSAVCSVSDAPPTLLVCVNRSSRANAPIKANGVLCVNILAPRHQGLSTRFAARVADSEGRFREEDGWSPMETGSPALDAAAVALDCRILSVSEVGSHSAFFVRVAAIRLGLPDDGLIYFDRRYHAVPLSPAA